MFCAEDPCAYPVEQLDLWREMETNGEESVDGSKKVIEDCWIGSRDRDESATGYEWVGETRFWFIREKPPPRTLLVHGEAV